MLAPVIARAWTLIGLIPRNRSNEPTSTRFFIEIAPCSLVVLLVFQRMVTLSPFGGRTPFSSSSPLPRRRALRETVALRVVLPLSPPPAWAHIVVLVPGAVKSGKPLQRGGKPAAMAKPSDAKPTPWRAVQRAAWYA